MWAPAPLGAVTKTLPPDAKSVWYQENEYFECDNVFFKKTPDGYKVIETPWKVRRRRRHREETREFP